MNSKTNTWIWTISAATAAGVLSLYAQAKNTAIKHLDRMGAFDGLRRERIEALDKLPAAIIGEPLRQNEKPYKGSLIDEDAAIERGKQTDNIEVQKINQGYMSRKRRIIHSQGVDNFSGAWKILSPEEKLNTLSFSAINSIVAGGITYALTNPRRSRGGGKGGNNACGAGCGGACAGCGH